MNTPTHSDTATHTIHPGTVDTAPAASAHATSATGADPRAPEMHRQGPSIRWFLLATLPLAGWTLFALSGGSMSAASPLLNSLGHTLG